MQVNFIHSTINPKQDEQIQWDGNIDAVIDFLSNTCPLEQSGDNLVVYMRGGGTLNIEPGEWIAKT